MIGEETAKIASELLSWAESQDFKGHEPHDLLESPILRGIPSKGLRLLAVQLGRRSPLDLHSLLGVPRTFNPKAGALFMDGLLTAREKIHTDWQQKAYALAQLLLDTQHTDGGWGYPFAWQSRTHYIEKGRSNIVTTAFAGLAMARWHAIQPTPETRQALLAATKYILHDVSRHNTEAGTAFGYAANDPQIVFNASLLGAEILATAGEMFGSEDLMSVARSAACFVASHQAPDGSWKYGLEPTQNWIDSFHTGFVVVSMRHIATLLDDDKLLQSAEHGFRYYQRTFIEPSGAIRYFNNAPYPIDAHALGQGILTCASFGDLPSANRIEIWSIEHMRSPKGYFFYQRHRFFTNRVAYLRWSNAWMFRGLAELIATV